MSEEEKNLEEIDLLKEAEESEEEIREETPEEEREPLTPEEIGEIRDMIESVRERRGGLRGAADPNMIQKHLDNFLAALCGETPVDTNVRTSTEYWLKRLADGEGGSTKKIYLHQISLYLTSEIRLNLFFINTSDTAITTWADLKTALKTIVTNAGLTTGKFMTSGTFLTSASKLGVAAYIAVNASTDNYVVIGGSDDNLTSESVTITSYTITVDDVVIPIN